MATTSTVEERLAQVEVRLGKLEETLDQQRRPWFAVTIEEARERLKTPAERGPEQFERLRRIFGRFDGPGDLSEHMRDYLYGERD